MPATLSVNLNAVAMLRNRRDLPWPSVTAIGRQALAAGAHGLTVHPRPDQRHIRFSDVPALRALLDAEYPDAEYNIEGYPSDDFTRLVLDNRPDQVTLVPDDPAQSTSDHGWPFAEKQAFLTEAIRPFKEAGLRVAVFCDPDASACELDSAAAAGADRVELFTGPYGALFDDPDAARAAAAALGRTAALAGERGLGVNAGHDLTVANLPRIVTAIPALLEVSIGHGITADALEFGIAEAVNRYLKALGR